MALPDPPLEFDADDVDQEEFELANVDDDNTASEPSAEEIAALNKALEHLAEAWKAINALPGLASLRPAQAPFTKGRWTKAEDANLQAIFQPFRTLITFLSRLSGRPETILYQKCYFKHSLTHTKKTTTPWNAFSHFSAGHGRSSAEIRKDFDTQKAQLGDGAAEWEAKLVKDFDAEKLASLRGVAGSGPVQTRFMKDLNGKLADLGKTAKDIGISLVWGVWSRQRQADSAMHNNGIWYNCEELEAFFESRMDVETFIGDAYAYLVAGTYGRAAAIGLSDEAREEKWAEQRKHRDHAYAGCRRGVLDAINEIVPRESRLKAMLWDERLVPWLRDNQVMLTGAPCPRKFPVLGTFVVKDVNTKQWRHFVKSFQFHVPDDYLFKAERYTLSPGTGIIFSFLNS